MLFYRVQENRYHKVVFAVKMKSMVHFPKLICFDRVSICSKISKIHTIGAHRDMVACTLFIIFLFVDVGAGFCHAIEECVRQRSRTDPILASSVDGRNFSFKGRTVAIQGRIVSRFLDERDASERSMYTTKETQFANRPGDMPRISN